MAVGQDDLSPNSTAVLFLKKTADGDYTFANRSHSKVPLAAFDPKIDEPQISLRERIGAQLRPQLASNDPALINEALDWADYIGYVFDDDQLQSLVAGDNLDVQIASLTRLVTRSNAQAVSQTIAMLLGRTDLTDLQVNDLAWALNREPDAVSVADAMRLAKVENRVVPRVAVQILAAIAKPSDVPELIECLDATDARDSQYPVIRSLATLTGQKVVMPQDFFAAPEGYIAYWKNWHASEGAISQLTSQRTAEPDSTTDSKPSASKVAVLDGSNPSASSKAALIGIAALVLLTITAFLLRRR
jgi:hypothetical protein